MYQSYPAGVRHTIFFDIRGDIFDQCDVCIAINKIIVVENKPEFKRVVDAANPGPIKYLDDAQKGRWGGMADNAGFSLEATFRKRDPLDDIYDIILMVKRDATATLPLANVFFFLHDSYYPECIQKGDTVDNSSSISIRSFEAFTAGVLCGNNQVKLELDLNNYKDSPEDYRYKEPLETIDELKQKLTDLTKEPADA